MMDKKIEILSHPVNVQVLPSAGFDVEIEADGEQREALARQTEILSIERFSAGLVFRRWRKNGVSVKGRLTASVTQRCVITLEPVPGKIAEDFERIFLPEGSKLAKPNVNSEGEMILDPEGQDIPDLFAGKTLDAWEILIEHFQLALDPFPRAPDAILPELDDLDQERAGDRTQSPFAALAALKADKKP